MSAANARAVALAAVLSIAACGTTQDDAARAIDEDPFGLSVVTTTTTTTAPPPATTVATTTTTAAPTTTATTVPTELVSLYYAVGDRIKVQVRTLPLGDGGDRLGPNGIVSLLAAGPGSADLQNLVSPGYVGEVEVERGRAFVPLTPAFVALAPPLQLAIAAQLVLTLTDRPGIGRVAFVDVDRVAMTVPRADGSGGDDLVAEDYTALLVT